MKYLFFNGRSALRFVFCLLLSSVVGCERHFREEPTVSMDKSLLRIEKLFEETKAVCFGRILIHVPMESTLVYGWTEVDSSIEYVKGHANEVKNLTDLILSEVEKDRKFMRKDDFERLPLFGNVIDGIVSGQKIVLGSKDRVGYSARSLVPIGEDLFIQSFDSLMPEENIVGRLNLVAAKLRLRTTDEVPSEEGLCIEGGFVSSEYQYERARLGIRFKEFPDVHLSVEAHKNLMYLPVGNSPRLLRKSASERASTAGLAAVFERIEIFRDRERQVSVWTGEEFAARTPRYKDSHSVHEFRFHSMGSINDSFHPELDIRLDSGVEGNTKAKAKPGITNEEALELWDKILRTIRLRRPSDGTSSIPVSPEVALGTLGNTGDSCPRTGWWECLETGRTEKDKRRYFTEGEQMPAALVTGRTNWWRFLIGDTHQIAAVKWKLIEYEGVQSSSTSPRPEGNALHGNGHLKDGHA